MSDDIDAAIKAADLRLKTLQARWETPKAVAMILLASAAIAASARLADLISPPRPQTITVHLNSPIGWK